MAYLCEGERVRRPLSRRFSSARAFTLIELLVVILVIGILIAVAAPSFLGQTDKAHESAAKQTLAVAYRAAKAGTIEEPNFGQFGTAAQVAADINLSEPGINASAGNCPADVSESVEDVIVDISYTGGGNLLLCNDPDRKIFYLKVTNGVLEPTGSVAWAAGDPAPTIPGDGPVAVVETITATGGPGNPVSTDDPPVNEASPGDPIETTVEPPVVGPVTITETPGPAAPEAGTDMIDWTVTVAAPAGTAADPISFIFIIDASLVPVGEDAISLKVFKGGSLVGACSGPAGDAVPDPCVDGRFNVAGGDIKVVVLSATDGTFTFGFPSAPVVGGACTGNLANDTPNNAAGAPANDDFCHAQLLSGATGSVNNTLVGSTVQGYGQNGTVVVAVGTGDRDETSETAATDTSAYGYDIDNSVYGTALTRSLWYVWTAPNTATYLFDTLGSPAPMQGCGGCIGSPQAGAAPFIGVFTGSDWSLYGAYPESLAGVTTSIYFDPASPTTASKVSFSATAGTQYLIWVTNRPTGSTLGAAHEGAITLNWAETGPADGDGDGIADGSDNCISIPNSNQTDYNSNGQGDVCDPPPLIVKITNNSGSDINVMTTSGVGGYGLYDPSVWTTYPSPAADVCPASDPDNFCQFQYAWNAVPSGQLALFVAGVGHQGNKDATFPGPAWQPYTTGDSNVLSWTGPPGSVGLETCTGYQNGTYTLKNACVFAPGNAPLVAFAGRVVEITAN